MGSLGSPGSVYITPKRDSTVRNVAFTTSKKQRSRTEGGSCSRRLSSTGSPGRFIPRRFSMDMEAANFQLMSPCCGSVDWSNEVFEDTLSWGSASARQQRQRLARLSEGASEKKILNFGVENKKEKDSKSRRGSERSSTEQKEFTFVKPSRKLPKYPEHVLDLPKLADDFYTHAMCWSSDGHLVAGLGSRLYACSLEGEGTTLLSELNGQMYLSVSCNETGSLLAATTDHGETQIWDLNVMKQVATVFHTHTMETGPNLHRKCKLVGLDWRNNSDIFAVGCGNGVVELIDMSRSPYQQIMTKAEPGSCISRLKFSENQSYLAASTGRHKIIVWDVTDMRNPTTIFKRDAHTSAIRALCWYPYKNSILASGGGIDDGYIRLWNVHTGEKIEEIAVRAQVLEVLWSPVTRELLTSQSVWDNHSVVVWDYPGLKKVGSLTGHNGRVLHMALSPCKTKVATAAADETLRIWDLKSGCGAGASTPSRQSRTFLLHGLR